MKKENYNILRVIAWYLFVIYIGLTIYVNYFLPHGPSYSTGEIVCLNDDRGPCGPEYKEDVRSLNIPEWAKFVRRDSRFGILLFVLPILAIYLQSKSGKEFRD